jgi:selenocysteine lyase/cysteine desulfurase
MIADGARHFDDFDGVTYLNCARMGPLPKVTQAAIREMLPLQSHPNRVPDDILFRVPNEARAALAPLIGARPEEIFLGSGATHGAAIAALGFPWQEGDEVLLTSHDFPSNLYIWTQAARRHRGRAVVIRPRSRAVTTDEVLERIGPATRVVSVSWVDYGSGEVMDLSRLGAVCRERDIFLVVDGTQAVGILPLAVHEPGISLLTVGGYKWMLSPYGSGFGWMDPAWRERIEPAYVTWTAAEGAEQFNSLPREGWTWVDTARRFDGPETASFLNVTGLTTSARFLAGIGLPAVHAHVSELLDRLEEGLRDPFRRRIGRADPPGPILFLEAENPILVHTAYERMIEARIKVSLREDGIRVSPHIYNTAADIDRLLDVLAAAPAGA